MKVIPPRTYLITGAAKRIGRAIAISAAERGNTVIVHYNSSKDDAEAFAGELQAMGAKAFTVQADLANPDTVSGLIDRAAALAGPIDVLVNSASIFTNSSLLDFTWDDLATQLRLNAFAPLVLARAFAAGRPGAAVPRPVIINLLDTRITSYDKDHAAYHLSKRLLTDLTKMLALELAPRIRVNAVAPGLILPPADKDPEYLRQLSSTNALKDIGSPEQIAAAVTFLVETEFITGQIIFVDGGRHLNGNIYV
jgi:pteridine reductase